MRIETTQQIVELPVNEITRKMAQLISYQTEKPLQLILLIYMQTKVKKFRNKITGIAISRHITIGSTDSADNYEEVTT